MEQLPSIRPGMAEWEIYESGEPALVENSGDSDDVADAELSLETLLAVPLGPHGLLTVGWPSGTDIDPTDRRLVEILGRNAQAAFELREQERRLADRERQLRTILENVPVILFAVDRNRELTLQVGRGLDRVGAEQTEMVGGKIDDLFSETPEIDDAVEQCFTGEAVDVTTALWGQTYQVWYHPVFEAGEVASVIGVAMDVTELTEYERQIAALHDATREMVAAPDEVAVC